MTILVLVNQNISIRLCKLYRSVLKADARGSDTAPCSLSPFYKGSAKISFFVPKKQPQTGQSVHHFALFAAVQKTFAQAVLRLIIKFSRPSKRCQNLKMIFSLFHTDASVWTERDGLGRPHNLHAIRTVSFCMDNLLYS